MALVTWSDALSVKVAEIDGQHKVLVSMINELNDAMKAGKGKDAMGKILVNLVNYTVSHFQTEEKYFEKYKYPDIVNHKKEHTALVSKVSEFKTGFDSGKLTMTIEVMNFLSDWLKNHIMGTDKKYSQFFNDNGLK